MSEAVTAEAARLAFLLFFGRPPESAEVIAYAMSFGTIGRLRAAFLSSGEFEFLLNRLPRVVSAEAPPLPVEWRVDDDTARAMLDRLRAAWADTPPGPPGDSGAGRDPDGALQARELLATLRRNGIDPAALTRAFEFGCGGGRVARHLRPVCQQVAGCDLSPLRVVAAEHVEAAPIDDLRFGMTAGFDLWYSHLILQAFPPPLIARVLDRALPLLRPGGAAVFQLPTYGYGYAFDPAAPPRADPGLERHVLPARAVFAIAARAGCDILEVFDDLAVAPAQLWRSTVFVMRKPPHGH